MIQTMKRFFIYAIMPLATLIATSCSKDFLNREPSEFISPEQIAREGEKDPSVLEGSISGLYSMMYLQGTGGTTNHDDFGQKGWDIFTDMLTSDMALEGDNYYWYVDIMNFNATRDFTSTPAYMPWRYYYRIIMSANSVIDALGGSDEPQTETSRRHVMGQAKAMRAYAYFYLNQLYSPKGYGDGTEKILPVYTDNKSQNQPRSTNAQVYELIVKDLNEAIGYLSDFSRGAAKEKVDAWVAKGLLAYVLAARRTQEDMQKVVEITNDIMNNSPFPLTTKGQTAAILDPETGNVLNITEGPGFNNVNTPSWMWGVDLQRQHGLGLGSWWGQVDYFTYSYASSGDAKLIDDVLYDQLREDDIRKLQFDEYYFPTNKFYAPARVWDGQNPVETDYIYMRADEFYLLSAEAYAFLNQDGLARTTLKKLLELRLDDISYVDDLSGQALKDEIYLQTRIELWGEGKSYLAMKRLKATVSRGNNHIQLTGQSWPYDSPLLTFPVPQAEVINNPNLNK